MWSVRRITQRPPREPGRGWCCYCTEVQQLAVVRRGFTRWCALAITATFVFAACSSGTSEPEATTSPTLAPIPAPVSRDRYDWRRAVVGAGGFVTGLVVGANGTGATFARTDVGGAYRWDSTADTWQQLLLRSSVAGATMDNGDYSVASIAVAPSSPSDVYLAVGDDFNPDSAGGPLTHTGSILRSRDGGRSWTRSQQHWFISGNQTYRVGTERLAVDPANPDHVLFGSQREGLWSSGDGGATWTAIETSLVPAGALGDPTVDQPGVATVAFAAVSNGWTAYAGVAGVGVFEGSSDGVGWRSIRQIDARTYAAGAVLANGRLYVALDTSADIGAVVASYDPSSKTWTDIALPSASGSWQFAMDPFDAQHMVLTDVAVRDDHLWSTTDGGSHWKTHSVAISSPQIPWLEKTDLAKYMSAGRLIFDPKVQGKLWFAEGMAVWTTDDVDQATVHWTSHARGIDEIVASSVVSPPGGKPVSAAADRQGFLFDDLNAARRKPLVDQRFDGGTSIDYSGGSPLDVAWIGAEYNLYNDPSRRDRGAYSSDGGKTWKQFTGLNSAMFGGEIAVSATNPKVLVWVPTHFDSTTEYLTHPVGVYVSTDAGASWTHQDAPGGSDALHRYLWWFTRRALAADRVTGDFYLMSDDGHFYVSADGVGGSWNEAKFAPPCVESDACHVYGQVQAVPGAAGKLWAGVGKGGLYVSDDLGASPWKKLPGVDEARAFGFGVPLSGSTAPTVFLYGRANRDETFGLYRSSDDGVTWVRLSEAPLDLYNEVNTVSGDPSVPGRVYVGFAGNGFVYGDDPAIG